MSRFLCWECLGPGSRCQSFKCFGNAQKRANTKKHDTSISSPALSANRSALTAMRERKLLLHPTISQSNHKNYNLKIHNKNKNSLNNNDFNDNFNHVNSDVQKQTRNNNQNKMEPFVALKAQLLFLKSLLSIKQWNTLNKQSSIEKQYKLDSMVDPIKVSSQKIDLILFVFSEHDCFKKNKIYGNNNSNTNHNHNKLLSKRAEQKQKAKEKRQKDKVQSLEPTEFHGLCFNTELNELLSLTLTQLYDHISQTMRIAIKTLYNASSATKTSSSSSSSSTFDESSSRKQQQERRQTSRPYKEDLIARKDLFSGHNMRGGVARKGPSYRLQRSVGIPSWKHKSCEDEEEEQEQEVEKGKVRNPRWKGKEKAKAETLRSWKTSTLEWN